VLFYMGSGAIFQRLSENDSAVGESSYSKVTTDAITFGSGSDGSEGGRPNIVEPAHLPAGNLILQEQKKLGKWQAFFNPL
jgi:hypothetical protein